MNSDGTKLSKRQNDLHLRALKERGIYPDALLNFVTLVGGGFEDKEYSLTRLFSLPELSERFQLGRIHTASCKIELDRLAALNQVALGSALQTATGRRDLVEELRKLLIATNDVDEKMLGEERLTRVLEWAQDRVTSLQQLAGIEFAYLWRAPLQLEGDVISPPELLAQILELLRSVANLKDFPNQMKQLCKVNGGRYPQVMKDLRLILSGRGEGPPVMEMLHILQREEAILRINNYLKSLTKT
jgi:glutamyl-tRNA synthetase